MRALVALVALAVLLVPSVALAQDKGSEKDTYSTLDLGVHGIFLGGSLDGTDDWNDFWKDGFGLSVGSSRLYRVSEPAEAGFYFRTTFDGFKSPGPAPAAPVSAPRAAPPFLAGEAPAPQPSAEKEAVR